MKGSILIRCVSLLLLSSLLPARYAIADDDSFYESLPDVTIGKVFFSPQQRARLDERRGTGGSQKAASNPSEQPRNKVTSDSAGYIISSDGVAKVYRNGDFRSARAGDKVVFPGMVKVVRSKNPDRAEPRDAKD